MIDTVGLSVQASGLKVADLERRGWGVTTSRVPRDGKIVERVKAFVNLPNGLTLDWYGSVGWLSVRGSLPRVLGVPNDVVLSWGDTVQALAVVTDNIAPQMTGDRLPALDRWDVWRFDPVWAWACDPAPYLDALRIARLTGSQAVCEPGSVRWRSLRSGVILGRVYDKSREAGRVVPLPTRLEREVRPKRQVVTVDGDRVGDSVSSLSERVCRGIVEATLDRCGLDRPIPSVMASRRVLIEAYGTRKGGNLWRELLAFSASGGWPSDYTDGKARRVERACRDAGIGALALNGDLPPLVLRE